MRVPFWVTVLGVVGLLPFFAGPAWLALSPESAPAWLDRGWWLYIALLGAFLAGAFWGFAMPAAMGLAGSLGLLIASVLMLASWGAMMLPMRESLLAFEAVFALLVAADVWRERVLDTIPGYLLLRSLLTVGAMLAMAWRLMLPM